MTVPPQFTAKTRVLEPAKTGGVEIEVMRGVWAEMQNRALERDGEMERVNYRSLEVQGEMALERGDVLSAEELDRAPEVKLGPAVNSIERRAQAVAEREHREYVPVTERGAAVHAACQARELFREMRERLNLARVTWELERESGQGRVSAGLTALRAAVAKDRGKGLERDGQAMEPGLERLREVLGREQAKQEASGLEKAEAVQEERSIRERLDDVLRKPRERVEVEKGEERGQEEKQELERSLRIKRGPVLEL